MLCSTSAPAELFSTPVFLPVSGTAEAVLLPEVGLIRKAGTFSGGLDCGGISAWVLRGEQGWGLSRGQAQRVALARVFLKDAPILLLDEPASGLDIENERLVMEAIDTLSIGRTVLLLTHRLTHIQTAQRVVVLAGGRIVEQGSYADLMKRPGIFRNLVEIDTTEAGQ